MEFSLFYFASDDDSSGGDKYRLLIEGAKFADRNGFSAVWTPERHFHAFGGLYPNPSVTGAAIAAVTRRVGVRAGSVVLPLHNPLRVAEEWAVVDNLSNGRVSISFASGWHSRDFVLVPEAYAGRKEIMFQQIEIVRRLWRGDAILLRDGVGTTVETRIRPRPIQNELPFWITSSGSMETFQAAGAMGANVLTHLLGQGIDALEKRIQIYREARQRGGVMGSGVVTLMLHSFMGHDLDAVRDRVRKPFCDYLRTSLDLYLLRTPDGDVRPEKLSDEDLEVILSHAFERYFRSSGLFGPPDVCIELVNRLRAVGVDEIACLIDFGIDFDSTMASLELLAELMRRIRT